MMSGSRLHDEDDHKSKRDCILVSLTMEVRYGICESELLHASLIKVASHPVIKGVNQTGKSRNIGRLESFTHVTDRLVRQTEGIHNPHISYVVVFRQRIGLNQGTTIRFLTRSALLCVSSSTFESLLALSLGKGG